MWSIFRISIAAASLIQDGGMNRLSDDDIARLNHLIIRLVSRRSAVPDH